MVTMLCVLAVLAVTCYANPIDQSVSTSGSSLGTNRAGCRADIIEGKGDFKLQEKVYPVKNPGFYIESIKLLKRTSFYRCEPKTLKYGVSEDSYSWWVNKGCEGLFEVLECPDVSRDHAPVDEPTKIDISIIQTYDTPVPTYDIQEIQIQGIENRFLYNIPLRHV